MAIQIKIIKNQQNHSFKEKFQQNKHYIDYKLACIDYEEILILYYGDEDIPDIIDLIHKDLEYFKSITHDVFKFGGGIGSAVSKLENVYESYRHAQLALKYRFLHGTDSLISFKDISNRSKLLVGIEFDSFKNLLKSSDINAISRFFNNFKASVNGKQIQIESVELMLMQTVLSMSKVIIDMNLHNSVISSTELATQFKKETFEETINGLLNIAIQIANYINNTSSSYYTGIVSKLKDYIDKHLSEDISLNVLAQVVSLSPSYVSTLFSEVLHMSFLDYLTNMRLEIASQLLRTEFISVSDIATKVGYRNSKYFCTKFKEKYGVTPMQYRGQ
ncbi:MAG: helix-turn-helix transcriptional regulator [Ignavibacterium sp.]|nr:MAG: helix-turn-helix transcriptional regulator [Ignavibacterium sp.]